MRCYKSPRPHQMPQTINHEQTCDIIGSDVRRVCYGGKSGHKRRSATFCLNKMNIEIQ